MNNADVPLYQHPETIADIMSIAEITFDKDRYEENLATREEKNAVDRRVAQAGISEVPNAEGL
jgi:hypothetical protein